MLQFEVFILKASTIDGLTATTVTRSKIASLDHEVGNDPIIDVKNERFKKYLDAQTCGMCYPCNARVFQKHQLLFHLFTG